MSSTTSGSLDPIIVKPSRIVIRAGAGAGKTTELINRILGQVLYFQKHEGRDPRLVVTTFTRKATQEIRERLLAKAQQYQDPKVLKYVQTSPFLSISTIHSSLQKYLGQYGSQLGLPPQFSFLDSYQLKRLQKRTLRNLLKDAELSKNFADLCEEMDVDDYWSCFQKWSMSHAVLPKLSAISALDLEQANLAFLQALQKDRLRLARLIQSEKLPPTWTQLGDLLATTGPLSLEQERALWEQKPNVRAGKNVPSEISDFYKELNAKAKRLLGWSFDPEFVGLHQKLVENFLKVSGALAAALDQEKIKRGQISMADLETWSLRLARGFPLTAKAFSEKWDFWMIDEYQDTSPLQVEVLQHLVGDRPEFVVGDPQQSIYLFRGARSQVFSQKEEQIKSRAGETLQKMTNYRTQPELMQLLNRYLPEFSSQFQPMQVHPEPSPSNFSGPRLTFWKVPETTEDLAIPLAEKIQQLRSQGVALSSICILTRSNSEVAQFSQALQQMGLDVNANRAHDPSESRELRDALCYLKFLVQPHDNINLVELLRTPWFGIPDRAIFKLAHSGSASFWSRRDLVNEPALEKLQKDLGRVHEVGVFQQWLDGIKEQGLLQSCYQLDPSGHREANLWKLILQVRWNERTPGFSYLQFIEERLSDRSGGEQVEDNVPAVIEPSRVQIMTIHKSKGLEFDHVLLASGDRESNSTGLSAPICIDEESGTFSLELKNKKEDQWHRSLHGDTVLEREKLLRQQESERILYVALTRAKESVTFISRKPTANSWAGRWPSWAQVQTDEPKPQIFPKDQKTQTVGIKPLLNLSELPKFSGEKVSTASSFQGLELIQTGIETHKWLEILQSNWDLDVPVLKSLRQLLARVQVVSMQHLIQFGHVEWGFVRRQEKSLVSGRIDLWGRDPEGVVWIVDYKTGSPEYRDKAIQQLKDYAHALIHLKQIKSADKIMLFPLYLQNLSASQAERYLPEGS